MSLGIWLKLLLPSFIHFASAFVAGIFSQLMASSSASWRLNKPPSSFVSGHELTMCSMVCCSPQSQSGDEARHYCLNTALQSTSTVQALDHHMAKTQAFEAGLISYSKYLS